MTTSIANTSRSHCRSTLSIMQLRRKHFDSSSESSGSEGDFRHYERKRRSRELNSIVYVTSLGCSPQPSLTYTPSLPCTRPVNRSGSKRDRERADVDPVAVDTSVTWASVGGLDRHLRALKEMVLLPLLYPEVFERFHVQPPGGVLFYGPPGECGGRSGYCVLVAVAVDSLAFVCRHRQDPCGTGSGQHMHRWWQACQLFHAKGTAMCSTCLTACSPACAPPSPL